MRRWVFGLVASAVLAVALGAVPVQAHRLSDACAWDQALFEDAVLVGLISFGQFNPDDLRVCAFEGSYPMFTRVSDYVGWIEQVVIAHR